MNRDGAVRIAQEAFKPITWSSRDTPPTVQQIKVHNEVGVELGLWKKPATKSKSWFKRTAKSKVAAVREKPIIQEPPEPPMPPVKPWPPLREPPNATAPSNDPRDMTPWWRR